MANILSNALLRLTDLSPLVRNNNAASNALSLKSGPCPVAFYSGALRMYFEGVSDTNNGGSDDTTGPMYATASTLQGPWTISPATRLFDPTNASTWEKFEASPSSIYWDNLRWIMWYHGGNNSGPRQVGVAYSTDGSAGKLFTRDAANPIIPNGAGGSTDALGVADLKILQKIDGTYVGFYTGLESGGAADGTVHRVTGTAPNVLTKQGRVINAVAASWNANGLHPGMVWIDPDSRLHIFCGAPTTGNGAIGYYYSDDNGATFTAYGSNPVASGTAVTTDADYATGDVVQGVYDGDVLFITSGGDNLSYPTNAPLRGQHAFITPARVTTPQRKGKFYLASSYTSVTGTKLCSATSFAVCVRFRAYRLTRGTSRFIYTEGIAFNDQAYIAIDGATGKLLAFARTPTGFTQNTFLSSVAVDDALWHKALFVRTATNAFALYLDGVQVATDTTTVGTGATATTKAVGAWDPSLSAFSGGDQTMFGTISDVVTIVGSSVTWAQAELIIRKRIFPSGVSATIDFPTAGSDNGSVCIVEAIAADIQVPSSLALMGIGN